MEPSFLRSESGNEARLKCKHETFAKEVHLHSIKRAYTGLKYDKKKPQKNNKKNVILY